MSERAQPGDEVAELLDAAKAMHEWGDRLVAIAASLPVGYQPQPPDAKRVNVNPKALIAVRHALQDDGAMTLAELATETGFSQSTCRVVVNHLAATGALRRGKRQPASGRGRPMVTWQWVRGVSAGEGPGRDSGVQTAVGDHEERTGAPNSIRAHARARQRETD